MIILTILVVIFLATTIYLIIQNQKLIGQLTNQTPISSPTAISQSPSPVEPTASFSPSPILTLAVTQDAIEVNINSKNYQGLALYMTNPLDVVLQATECCGEQTPSEAISQMDYINNGVPFDFDQELPTIKNLKAKNPELSDKFIGISKGKEHMIAFKINSQNKISSIRMSVSWKLFNI